MYKRKIFILAAFLFLSGIFSCTLVVDDDSIVTTERIDLGDGQFVEMIESDDNAGIVAVTKSLELSLKITKMTPDDIRELTNDQIESRASRALNFSQIVSIYEQLYLDYNPNHHDDFRQYVQYETKAKTFMIHNDGSSYYEGYPFSVFSPYTGTITWRLRYLKELFLRKNQWRTVFGPYTIQPDYYIAHRYTNLPQKDVKYEIYNVTGVYNGVYNWLHSIH